MKRIVFIILMVPLITNCSSFRSQIDSEWHKDENGLLHIQEKGKSDSRELCTGDVIMEYGGREDYLVKEKYLYKNGKLDELQILWYGDGLHVQKIYKNGKLMSEKILNGKPPKIFQPF